MRGMKNSKKRSLLYVVIVAAIGGFLFGFDSGVISGGEQAIQAEFGLSAFWHGLIVSGVKHKADSSGAFSEITFENRADEPVGVLRGTDLGIYLRRADFRPANRGDSPSGGCSAAGRSFPDPERDRAGNVRTDGRAGGPCVQTEPGKRPESLRRRQSISGRRGMPSDGRGTPGGADHLRTGDWEIPVYRRGIQE